METLLLDCSYVPLDRICWQRAITLWWLDKVEIVEEYEDREIRSVSFVMRMPAVVRFLAKVRGWQPALKFSRENVMARDEGRCQYCGKKLRRIEATFDHVVPRRLGGPTKWENVVIACLVCNQRKGGRTPEQAGMKLRKRPVRPRGLPGNLRFTVIKDAGVPSSWRQYLSDAVYWHGALESDDAGE